MPLLPRPRRNHKRVNSRALAAVLVLIAAGCGSESAGGYEVADRVIAAVGEPAESVVVFDSGCERTVSIDEYGFESEVVTCPDNSAPLDPPSGGLQPGDPINADELLVLTDPLPPFVYEPLASAAPEPIRQSFMALLPSLDELDRSCGVDLAAWQSALQSILEQTTSLQAQLEDADLAGFIGSSPARALGRSLFERTLFQPGCAAPGAIPVGLDDPVLVGLLPLTADASASVAAVDRIVSGSIMSRLFHFFSALPAYNWLRNPVAPAQVVLLGSSQTGAAIDVPGLSDRLGRTVGNAFLPGSLAEVQQIWIHELYRYAAPDLIIWPMGPVDLLGTCISPGRAEQFSERLANRRAAFRASGWFEGVDDLDLLLGPVGTSPNVNMGNAPKERSRNDDAIAAQLPDYTNQFADPSYCSDRAAVTGEVIEQLRAWGATVVIVGMAVSPEAVDLIPGGRDTVAASFDRLETEVVGPTGAEFIDLSRSLDELELWGDLTHLNQSGANRFTQLLADQLEARGMGQ